MTFNFFPKKPKHLHADLPPGERIDKLFVEFVYPVLEPKEFNYSKSKREFKKKNNFFDFQISWYGRKYNQGDTHVEFDLFINVFSPKYRKWETEFYQLEKNWGNAIDGGRAEDIDGWDKQYCESGWYDLVKYDNDTLMEKVRMNVENAGFAFFENYISLDSAIQKLKEYPIKNFEKIIDFYLLLDKQREAIDFFENNKQWHEEQERSEGHDPNSYYCLNRKLPFERRKEKLKGSC